MLFVWLNAGLHDVGCTLIDNKRTGFIQAQTEAVHGAWGGTLKIVAALIVAPPMARTFVLILGQDPAGGTTQMGTLGRQGVEALRDVDNPDPKLLRIFFADFANRVVSGRPSFER